MKLIIIEDDPRIVDFISLSFQIGWPELEIRHTSDGQRGVTLVRQENPDMVLLDIGLPDMSGFDVLKSIRLFSQVPVIIITIYGEETDVVKGLQLGADDYVVKPFRQLELMARVKAVFRRQQQNLQKATAEPATLGPWHLDASRNRLCRRDREVRLTPTECSLILHLVRNTGQVVTLKSISEELWGTDYPGAHHAIRVYIQRLREKVEPDISKPSLIITKPGIGYYVNKLQET